MTEPSPTETSPDELETEKPFRAAYSWSQVPGESAISPAPVPENSSDSEVSPEASHSQPEAFTSSETLADPVSPWTPAPPIVPHGAIPQPGFPAAPKVWIPSGSLASPDRPVEPSSWGSPAVESPSPAPAEPPPSLNGVLDLSPSRDAIDALTKAASQAQGRFLWFTIPKRFFEETAEKAFRVLLTPLEKLSQWLESLHAYLEALQKRVDAHDAILAKSNDQRQGLEQSIRIVEGIGGHHRSLLNSQAGDLSLLRSQLQSAEAKEARDIDHHSYQLAALQGCIKLMQQRFMELEKAAACCDVTCACASKGPSLVDAFYLAVQESRPISADDRMARYRDYMPEVLEVLSQFPHAALLDLGCGPGVWLQEVRSHSVAQRFTLEGVDTKLEEVGACLAEGFAADCQPLHEHLRQRADASVAVVTAFGPFGGLQLNTVLAWLKEVHRILVPGGLVIFEVPNPADPDLASFVRQIPGGQAHPLDTSIFTRAAQHVGFGKIQARACPKHESPATDSDSFSPPTATTARDFAVFAWKPNARI